MIVTLMSMLVLVFGLGANGLKFYKQLPGQEIEPWTPEWYQLCTERFTSFEHKTGLWTDFKGVKHFCRFHRVEKEIPDDRGTEAR